MNHSIPASDGRDAVVVGGKSPQTSGARAGVAGSAVGRNAGMLADDHHRDVTQALSRGDREGFCNAIAADIEQGMRLLE